MKMIEIWLIVDDSFIHAPTVRTTEEIEDIQDFLLEHGGSLNHSPYDNIGDIGKTVRNVSEIRCSEYNFENGELEKCIDEFIERADSEMLEESARHELSKALRVTRGEDGVLYGSWTIDEIFKGLQEDVDKAQSHLSNAKRFLRSKS